MFKIAVDLLLPHFAIQNQRRSIILQAFSDQHHLLYEIDYDGPASEFTPRLIDTLQRQGEIAPGRQALWHLLLTIRDNVGLEQQIKIDALKEWANKPHSVPYTSQVNNFSMPNMVGSGDVKWPLFMAPTPPAYFVPRPEEFKAIKQALMEHVPTGWQTWFSRWMKPRQAIPHTPVRVGVVAAFAGAGGFGKTTLAQAICQDDQVKSAFTDGILWIEVGEQPNLVEKARALIAAVGGNPASVIDLQTAQGMLIALLQKRRVLLVIDDVWSRDYERVFLSLGGGVTTLITTRNTDYLPEGTSPLSVGEMTSEQSLALFTRHLTMTIEQKNQCQIFIERYKGWALLLELANSYFVDLVNTFHYTIETALAMLEEKYKAVGVFAWDRQTESGRQYAVNACLEPSLARLDHKTGLRRLFGQLALFKDDTAIPLGIVARLWCCDEQDAEERLMELHKASLVKYSGEKKSVRLHDMIRQYLRDTHHAYLPQWNREFLDTYKISDWYTLSAKEAYLWRWLAYHLVEAEQAEILRDLLMDDRYLQTKLKITDVNALLTDYVIAKATQDETLKLIESAIQMSNHVLAVDRTAIRQLLVGRLMGYHSSHVILKRLIDDWINNISLSPLHHDSQYPTHNLVGGPLVHTLIGHSSRVKGVALNADASRALSASSDKTLILWDLHTGTPLRTLKGHTDWVTSVALNADVSRALSASSDKTLILWDLHTGTPLLTLKGHTAAVNDVALNADASRAISASDDGTLILWELYTGTPLCTLKGHTDWVRGVALNADASRAISASSDSTLILWDLHTGTPLLTLKGHIAGVWGVALNADASRAISASSDGTLILWSLHSGIPLRTFKAHTDWVKGVALNADASRAISASDDGTLVLWDLNTDTPLRTFKGHTDAVNDVALTSDASRAISASFDHTLILWDLITDQALPTLKAHTDWVIGVALNVDASCALSASGDGTFILWDLDTGTPLRTLRGHTDWVRGVGLNADASRVLSASSDGTLMLWDLNTGIRLLALKGHTDWVRSVALNVNASRALSASDDGTLILWDLHTGTPLRTLKGHFTWARGVALNADASRALFSSSNKLLILWDLNTGTPLHTLTGHAKIVTDVALNADASRALSASDDGTLILWDLHTGTPLCNLKGHTDSVTSVALNADASRALSASQDHTLKVWDLLSGRCLATYYGDDPFYSCAFSESAGIIVGGDRAGRVLFLRFDESKLLKA